MAARKWTNEQKAKQSALIHTWKPWRHSTGARTFAGKAIVSRNAYKGGKRIITGYFKSWISNLSDTC